MKIVRILTVALLVAAVPLQGTGIKLELSNPRIAFPGSTAVALLTVMPPTSFIDSLAWRVIKHVLLIVSTIGLLMGIGQLAVRQAGDRAREWTNDFQLEVKAELSFPPESPVPPGHQARLKGQLIEVGGRIAHHTSVMAFFYSAYYMSIVTFSIAAAVAAVVLVLVSKSGWESSNEYIVTMFFTTTAASAFFGSFPAIFQQQQNITDNKVFSMKYLALKNEILTYAVTSESLNYDVTNPLPLVPATADAPAQKPRMGIILTPTEFLHYVDLQLSRDNVAIGFDVKQVANYKGALEMK